MTKMLADRLAEYMDELIHVAQSGFVGARLIHDTIDWLTATRKLVRLGLAPRDAVMLMLDLEKAYDALDRQYLLRALR